VRITVLGGSGQMGRVAAQALARTGAQAVVADRVPPSGDLPASVEFIPTDAASKASILAAVAGSDAVMNFVGPYYRFGTDIAAAVIDAGLPYVDVCDDADTTVELLALHDRAVERDVPLITGAGGSPGVLNMLARIAASGFTVVDRLLAAWVIEPHAEGGPAVIAHTIHCVADPYPAWRDGETIIRRAHADGAATTFPFPSPIGPVQVRDIGHPEPVTLSRVIRAREIRTVGGIVPEIAFDALYALVSLGLASIEPLQLRGAPVVPRDFLAAYLDHLGGNPPPDPERERVGLGVEVTGTIDGEDITRHLTFANRATLAESTALPAVASLAPLLGGEVPAGVHGPEVLDPVRWLGELGRLQPGLYDGFYLLYEGGAAEAAPMSAEALMAVWQGAGQGIASPQAP
jgi:lysine 6-dehydrogenase